MRLVIDIESRSSVDLKTHGAFKYAENPNTQILCVAFKEDAKKPVFWCPKELRCFLPSGFESITKEQVDECIIKADVICAHNAFFERSMWQEIMVKRHGFYPLPFERVTCTAAKAASYALPRSLSAACKVLGLSEQKDDAGKKLMQKMCKPRKDGTYFLDASSFFSLVLYCMQDVNAEYELDKALYDLSESEQELFRLDQKINMRGVPIDLKSVKHLIEIVEAEEKLALAEVAEITGGVVTSTRQVAATLAWLKTQGVFMDDLQKENVATALSMPCPDKAKRILELRQTLSKSSTAKLQTMLDMACRDGRVRDTLLFHGAATGRWSGRGIQTQNFPRESYPEADLEYIVTHDRETIKMLYGCPIKAASACLRGMIKAAPGKLLFCADFSSIEARVLAWVAGQADVIQSFEKGLDLYKVTAAKIYNVAYDDITKEQRHIGKIAVLALGYGGSKGAFDKMAQGYGVKLPEEKIVEIVQAWRRANPAIVKFWYCLEEAAIKAIKTQKPHDYGRIKFGTRGNFLHCRLPSGRLLSYPFPCVKEKEQFGRTGEAIFYMGTDPYTRKWSEQDTWGGCLSENIAQAIARDVMADAVKRLEAKGFPIITTCHDEIVCESDRPESDLKEFENIMCERPQWAGGLPLAASGWVGERYRK